MQPNTHNLKHNYKFYQRIQEVKKIYEELNKLKKSNNKHLSDTQENIRIRLMKWWKEFRFWKLKANEDGIENFNNIIRKKNQRNTLQVEWIK